jgi:hypothetical protein
MKLLLAVHFLLALGRVMRPVARFRRLLRLAGITVEVF